MIPRSKVVNESIDPKCRTIYRNAHEYHINSLSLSSDGENFISTDDLRINLWHIDENKVVYNLLDLKSKISDDVEETITHSEFHP